MKQTTLHPSFAPELQGGSTATGQPRQRAMRADVQIAHQAMKVASPTNQQIGPWQRQAARLLALAEKGKLTGADLSGIALEATAMLRDVEAGRKALRRDVSKLPEEVAGSSRLEDTERALQSVAAVLHKTLLTLGIQPRR